MGAVVALVVVVVVESMVEAVAEARINFGFSSTNIGNTYTYTSSCDRFEKERQKQSVNGERERIVSLGTQYYFIIYSISQSVVTKGTDQVLSLRHNNITH